MNEFGTYDMGEQRANYVFIGYNQDYNQWEVLAAFASISRQTAISTFADRGIGDWDEDDPIILLDIRNGSMHTVEVIVQKKVVLRE